MLSDSIVSLGGLAFKTVADSLWRGQDGNGSVGGSEGYQQLAAGEDDAHHDALEEEEKDAPKEHLVPMKVVTIGLIASGVLCIAAVKIVFGAVQLYAITMAFLLALPLSMMGVRALGISPLL
jgi:hypothetical protein